MKILIDIFIPAALIAAVLTVLGWILGVVLPTDETSAWAAGGLSGLMLSFVASFVLAAPLYFPVSRSRLTGRSLLGVVFLAVFGLTTVLTLVEAALFLQMTTRELMVELVRSTLVAAALAWLAVTLYQRAELESSEPSPRENPPSSASWVRRWVGVSLLYVVLYLTAGLLILPIIRTWYESQGMLDVNPAVLLPLQIARGALYVAFVVPLLRSMQVSRWQAGLSMAVMVPLVHGVAGLIAPNPYMPDHVRYAHMVEIGWSNFVLGLVIGFLFWKPCSSVEESSDSR